MNGQRIGDVRVSSLDQNPDRQLEQISVDRTFTDTASGKDVARPELDALMRFAREGDTVVVHSMDRLARNLDDLRQIVRSLTARGVRWYTCTCLAAPSTIPMEWGSLPATDGAGLFWVV